MKLFKFRGKHRIVGNVQLPSPEALEAQKSKGFFHELVGDTDLPPCPKTVDYLTVAKAAEATMLDNGPDSTSPVSPVGDCVIAADLHLAGLRACNAGNVFIPTAAQALSDYSAVTGYVLGNSSTDQGTDPLALIAYRMQGNAYPDGSTLIDAIDVDATNQVFLETGIFLAVGALAWASLPDEWESEEDAGDTWDVAGDPNPSNGHGFGLVEYNAIGPVVETWGEQVQMTWAAAAKYLRTSGGGGCVALLDADCISSITSKCPSGYDLSTLTTYVKSIGNDAAVHLVSGR